MNQPTGTDKLASILVDAARPIIHKELPPDLLEGIRDVHFLLKDVLLDNDSLLSLEQFEVDFMREPDAYAELNFWNDLAVTYNRLVPSFPADLISRRKLFQNVFMLALGIVDKENPPDQEIATIVAWIEEDKKVYGFP